MAVDTIGRETGSKHSRLRQETLVRELDVVLAVDVCVCVAHGVLVNIAEMGWESRRSRWQFSSIQFNLVQLQIEFQFQYAMYL